MAQVNTTLPTGIRAANIAVAVAGPEQEILLVKGGDGGQLKLVEVDGHTSADAIIRVYSVQKGFATPLQLATFAATAAVGNFNQKMKLVVGQVDEVAPLSVPFLAAKNLGMIGQGGIRITAEIAGGGTISMAATTDRRVDGPYDFVA